MLKNNHNSITRIVVVRHGEAEHNVILDILENNVDANHKHIRDSNDKKIKLTHKGHIQAKKTGYELNKFNFDICLSSPYVRTIQTSKDIISEFDRKIRIIKDKRLREKDFGKLHGFSTDQIKKEHPDEYIKHERIGKYHYRPPKGESWEDVRIRIKDFIKYALKKYSGKTILVVAHSIPCKMFYAIFYGLSDEQTLSLKNTDNCGCSEYVSINFDKKIKTLYYNKILY